MLGIKNTIRDLEHLRAVIGSDGAGECALDVGAGGLGNIQDKLLSALVVGDDVPGLEGIGGEAIVVLDHELRLLGFGIAGVFAWDFEGVEENGETVGFSFRRYLLKW